MIRHPDIVTGAFLIVVGAFMFFLSGAIHITPGIHVFTAQFFPRLMSAILVACGVGLVIQSFFAEREKLPFMFNRANFLIAAFFCLYFFTFESVDFRFGTWALMLASMWVLGARGWVRLAATPIVTALVIDWMFTNLFEAPMPKWI